MSAGHIRPRGRRSWELKFDAGRDPATGERKIQYHSFKGTKSEAKIKLAELIAAVGKGTYVERPSSPSPSTSGDASTSGRNQKRSRPGQLSGTASCSRGRSHLTSGRGLSRR
jgi:hypothetical protein